MDLSLLTTTETAECVIKDPVTGNDTDIVITVCGVYSEQYRTAARKASATENYENFLADLTVDWAGLERDGKALLFTYENAVDVYKSIPAIRTQVDRCIGDIKNFFPKR